MQSGFQGGLQLGAGTQTGGLKLNTGLGQSSGEGEVIVVTIRFSVYM